MNVWIHRAVAVLLFAAVLIAAAPRSAQAQWYIVGYFGVNHTRSADVAIDVPGQDLSVTYHDVAFSAKPFASPQYYGYRVGKLFGASGRLGVEVEFIHLKVIGETSADYLATGRADGVTLPGVPTRMSTLVEQYQMTHGLNFVLVNVVHRLPVGGATGPIAVITRAGAGPTVPHAESRVGGTSKEQYEYAGIGAHLAAGLDVRLGHRASAVIEYKITIARPEITIAGGTGRTTALTNQLAFGLAFGLAR